MMPDQLFVKDLRNLERDVNGARSASEVGMIEFRVAPSVASDGG
jgi:hypothetical protein